MKRIAAFCLSAVLLLGIVAWYNNQPAFVVSALVKQNKLRPGELKYIVNFLGAIPAGEAVLFPPKEEKLNGEDTYHLRARVENLKIYHWIRRVSASADSYVDIIDLNPIKFATTFSITGKEDARKEVSYDQKNHIIQASGVRRHIPAGTQDPLSLLIQLKKTDFSRSPRVQMNINTNQKNYLLDGKVRYKDLKVSGNVYRLYILNAGISRRGKNPYHQVSLNVVFLKDKENIPILIRVFAGGVVVSARLTDIR